jgi:hypothetical protein
MSSAGKGRAPFITSWGRNRYGRGPASYKFTLTNSSDALTKFYLGEDAPPPGDTGQIKVYLAGVFTSKPVKVWNGANWAVKPLKFWNGTSWITTPY